MRDNRILVFLLIAVAMVAVIVFLVKKAKAGKQGIVVEEPPVETPPQRPTPTPTSTSTPTSTVSSGGPAKIFVNGGRPLSGSLMGRIYVDGRSMALFYSDAPLEISIPSGKHHIVIEGGHVGDARVDRMVDFGTTDVLTVDMPGGDDDDVIRFQLVSYYEYRKAIQDCGFRVTRKSF